MRFTFQSLAGIAAALAFGSTALAATTPVGLGCSSGYTLVIESNVLTCKKQTTGTTSPVMCLRPATTSGPGSPPVAALAVPGNDLCPSGSTPAPCPETWTRKVDYEGTRDKCVKAGGITYEAPVQK